MKLDFVCLDADQAIMETGATSPAMHVNLDAIELQENVLEIVRSECMDFPVIGIATIIVEMGVWRFRVFAVNVSAEKWEIFATRPAGMIVVMGVIKQLETVQNDPSGMMTDRPVWYWHIYLHVFNKVRLFYKFKCVYLKSKDIVTIHFISIVD